MTFNIPDQEAWEAFTAKIIPEIKFPLLLLKGDLGAGKTTFTQFLLKEMGCIEAVSSPTYAIVNEYHTPSGKVFHFDLYRLKSAEEVFDIGIEDYLESGHFCIIEWPEVYETELADIPHHLMEISTVDNGRVVNFH